MKKFIGIVGIGLICCLIFVILWRGKNPERNDVYGLMYQKLTPAFKENGYQVRALNLQDIQKSDGYNPIVYVRTMKEALMVADYMLGESKDIDVFFNEAEKQLLAACILYAAYQKPEYKNFFFVSKILLKGLSKEETSIFEFLIDTFSKVSDISIAEELSMTLKHFSERMLKILVPILCHKIMEPLLESVFLAVTWMRNISAKFNILPRLLEMVQFILPVDKDLKFLVFLLRRCPKSMLHSRI